ncbi:MAG: hypothetical protein ABEJ79_01310 [Halolamina sp.]
MPADAVDDPERVNAFRVGGSHLFRHYFEGESMFDRLKPYYEPQEYRFAVPTHRFERIQAFLGDRGYSLVDAAPESYAVVVKKYTSYPENVFKASVYRRSVEGYNCFVLRDRGSVDRTVRQGATRLTATDFEPALETPR